MELHQLKISKAAIVLIHRQRRILHVEITKGVRIHSNGILLYIKLLKETYLAGNSCNL